MPLRITPLQISLHGQFYIGAVRVTVVSIDADEKFTLQVDKAMTERYAVSNRAPVEILPSVTVSAVQGTKRSRSLAYLRVEAPEQMHITVKP